MAIRQFRFECETKRKQIKFHRKHNDFSTSIADCHTQQTASVQLFREKERKTIAFVIIVQHFFLLLFVSCYFMLFRWLSSIIIMFLYVAIHPWGVCVGFEGIWISILLCQPYWLCIKVINFMNRALKLTVKKKNCCFFFVKLNEWIRTTTLQSYDHRVRETEKIWFPPLIQYLYLLYTIMCIVIYRNTYASLN